MTRKIICPYLFMFFSLSVHSELSVDSESIAHRFLMQLDAYCVSNSESECRQHFKSYDLDLLGTNEKIGLANMYLSLKSLYPLDFLQESRDRDSAAIILQEILLHDRKNKLALRIMSGATENDSWEGMAYTFELLSYHPDSAIDHLAAASVLGWMTEANIIARAKFHIDRAVEMTPAPNKSSRAVYFYSSLIRRGMESQADEYRSEYSNKFDHENEASMLYKSWESAQPSILSEEMREALRGYCFGSHIELVGSRECESTISMVASMLSTGQQDPGVIRWLVDSYLRLSKVTPLTPEQKNHLNSLLTPEQKKRLNPLLNNH